MMLKILARPVTQTLIGSSYVEFLGDVQQNYDLAVSGFDIGSAAVSLMEIESAAKFFESEIIGFSCDKSSECVTAVRYRHEDKSAHLLIGLNHEPMTALMRPIELLWMNPTTNFKFTAYGQIFSADGESKPGHPSRDEFEAGAMFILEPKINISVEAIPS